VLASVHEELCAEREKRRDADEGKKAAVDLARSLSAQNDAMREEIERLNMVLRRLDVSTAASSEDARGMAAMFKGMAAEAEAYAAAKEEEEAQQQAREDEIDTERMVPLSAVDGSASGAPSAADSAKEKDDAEFQALQVWGREPPTHERGARRGWPLERRPPRADRRPTHPLLTAQLYGHAIRRPV